MLWAKINNAYYIYYKLTHSLPMSIWQKLLIWKHKMNVINKYLKNDRAKVGGCKDERGENDKHNEISYIILVTIITIIIIFLSTSDIGRRMWKKKYSWMLKKKIKNVHRRRVLAFIDFFLFACIVIIITSLSSPWALYFYDQESQCSAAIPFWKIIF